MKSICKINNKEKINLGNKYWVIPNTEKDGLSYKGYGILHRENGPAIECVDGTKIWLYNGLKHRQDGPAMEGCNNTIWWYLNNGLIEPSIEMLKKYIKLNPDNILKDYEYPLEIQIIAISLKPNVIFNILYPHPKLKELYPQLYTLKKSGLI